MDGSRFSSCSMSTIGDRGRGSNESPWMRKDEKGGMSSCRDRMYLVSHSLS